MTRAELIEALVVKHNDLPPDVVDEVVREIFEQLIKSLASSQRIEIRGFGSFEVRVRAPRIAHNPKTGEKVEVGERRVVHFKPGVDLRERVNSIKPEELQ